MALATDPDLGRCGPGGLREDQERIEMGFDVDGVALELIVAAAEVFGSRGGDSILDGFLCSSRIRSSPDPTAAELLFVRGEVLVDAPDFPVQVALLPSADGVEFSSEFQVEDPDQKLLE